MKVYVDSLERSSTIVRRQEFSRRFRRFADALRAGGIEVVNFTTPDLPFDPFEADIADFVAFVDVVAVLAGGSSLGFSMSALEASKRLQKPRFLFVEGEINRCVCRESYPSLFFYGTFASEEYPAKAIREEWACSIPSY